MIKVLIVYRDNLKNDNVFVKTLFTELQNFSLDICCSLDNFWNEELKYDLIHFQWPEELTLWNSPDSIFLERLKGRLISLKNQGTKIIYTRHNLIPHYITSNYAYLYSLIEEYADAIAHLGQYSLNEFETKYPDKHIINRVIPHHIYEHVYNEIMTQEEARKTLGIPKKRFVILSFGKFRHKKEVEIALQAFYYSHLKNKYFLAPRFWPFEKWPKNDQFSKRIASIIGYYLIRPFFNLQQTQLGLKDRLVNEEDIPLYFHASDLILIQRHEILNSGNLTMGFLFKKVVVGPDCGNITELLQETQNPIFEPYNIRSMAQALAKGYELTKNDWGKHNYDYAKAHWNVKETANKYYNLYRKTWGGD